MSSKLIFICLLFISLSFSNPPKDGYVPNEETAILISKAILIPMYGKNVFDGITLQATLVDSIWKVSGVMKKLHPGGVPYVEIKKRNGEIINAYHTK